MEDVRPLSSERGSVARKKVFHSVYSNQNNNFLSSLDKNNVRNIFLLVKWVKLWDFLFKNSFEYKRKFFNGQCYPGPGVVLFKYAPISQSVSF